MDFAKTDTAGDLKFVRAQQKDVDILFEWINEDEVRAQSLSTQAITYTEHTNWFAKKLNDKNCYLYIVYKNNKPAGMIRFDIQYEECIISYLVAVEERGKGIGFAIVNKGIKQLETDSDFTGTLKALVKNTNLASLKIFERLGFKKKAIENNIISFKKLK